MISRVFDLLDTAASARPDDLAVVDDAGEWTYGQLADHSHGFAAWLTSAGIGAGDRVVVEATPRREFVAMLYGCLRIGGIFVPISPSMKEYQRDHVLADAEPAIVIADSDQADVWQQVRATLTEPFRSAEVLPTDIALLIYTSGTTAAPKAVVSHHGHVVFATGAIGSRLRYRPDDAVLCRLSLAFDYGLYQVFLCAQAGARLILPGQGAPDLLLLAEARRNRATVVPVVPSLATILLHCARRDRASTGIRLFTNTGEALSPATIARLREHFPGAGIQLMYGTTECKRISILEVDGDLERPGSVGRPLDGTKVDIVGEDGRPLPAGETGEIVVRGPHVMAGYWRSPELTERTFRTDQDTGTVALHTGDYGCLDSVGHIYFHGRRDDMFKRRGTRTSVQEIEAAAKDIPGVAEAVLLLPNEERDIVLCAVATIGPADILSGLGERLDSAKVPDVCLVFDHFDRSSNGKIDRESVARRVS
ncbi:class I adenylate-forming enzyme family protein [Actinocrispum wychmicini]|uniref:Amino acid adenylation domain-containing protein n=1 Tax=Actinocrispum wychmicini TaxID=1213861 RepID=A0A4V2S821_9PSEU|nr:AMP-binding protein [Actinocrispum wychmicini]TCO61890.1 amino acid adenylation domain-containing protein [Actinocrispum wychmicini]